MPKDDRKLSRATAWLALALAVSYAIGLSCVVVTRLAEDDLASTLLIATLPLVATLPAVTLVAAALRSRSDGPIFMAVLIVMLLTLISFLGMASFGWLVFPIAFLMAIATAFAAIAVPGSAK